MISVSGIIINPTIFPDGTKLLHLGKMGEEANIRWKYESDDELITLMFLTKHLRTHGTKEISLFMPYIPNARMDRVKSDDEVFTLKYFADIINSLEYNSVVVLDPHSYVSEALFNNLIVLNPKWFVSQAARDCNPDYLFFPDEGAMKRYNGMADIPFGFGIKRRDWKSGKIEGLDVAGINPEDIVGKKFLIIDDICSKGGTFYYSSKKLKELGAGEIYLYVTHCENTIHEGELLKTDLIKKIYTTDSIITKKTDKMEVMKL